MSHPVSRNATDMRTNDGASKYHLFTIDYKTPDRTHWNEILQERADVLDDVNIVGKTIILTYLQNASTKIERISLDGKPQGSLELPGIGKDLAEKICAAVQTGQFPQLVEARAAVPAGVLEMLRISGLGPKKAAALFKELSIQSLDDLRNAAEQGLIAKLKGFGKKTEQSILEGVAQAADSPKGFLLAEVKPEADAIVADLLTLPSVSRATLTAAIANIAYSSC